MQVEKITKQQLGAEMPYDVVYEISEVWCEELNRNVTLKFSNRGLEELKTAVDRALADFNKPAPVPPPLPPLTDYEYKVARLDGKISAIKEYRVRTQCTLKEAKDKVEAAPNIEFKY
jgi:ribosomal protein L7/L12